METQKEMCQFNEEIDAFSIYHLEGSDSEELFESCDDQVKSARMSQAASFENSDFED
jgi:hypothetical protein